MVAEVGGGVCGDEGLDLQAPVDARVERAIAAQGEAVLQLGQADEDEGEQGFAVPLVVQEDVQVVKARRSAGDVGDLQS